MRHRSKPRSRRLPLAVPGLLTTWGWMAVCGLASVSATIAAETVIAAETADQEPPAKTADQEPPAAESQEPPAAELIEKLGSPSYATRVRAREALQRRGLSAFDALQAALSHPDAEIAKSARRLVGSLWVRWAEPGDPPAVEETLEQYGAQSERDRASRIELLGELPGGVGLPALARLARYEPSLRLSERAALVLMRHPLDADAERRAALARSVRKAIGENDRAASRWLRVYAGDLAEDRFAAERWRELIAEQRELVEKAASELATDASVTQLVRVAATRGAAAGERDEAIRIVTEHLDLIPGQLRDLIEASSWALDNGLQPIVLALFEKHRELFDRQPLLLYAAAEAHVRAGDDENAESLAEQAIRINALPTNPEDRDQLSEKELEEMAHARREIGEELASRGLFEWAEREFRHVVETLDVTSVSGAFTRVKLARMLGELRKHEEVVELLEPLITRLEQDDQLNRQLNNAMFANTIRSDQEFHRGLALVRQGREEAAAPVLEKAWDLSNPPNIDILIAMYRLPGDEERKGQIRETLERTIRVSETDIRNAEIKSRQMGQFGFGDEQLASELNQYAWLVSNTEGDYRKALRYSQRSLELSPDEPALLDTCARCHFAVGEIAEAVRVQRKAVRLQPHSPPMERQLEAFERALAEKADTPNSPPAAP